MEVSYSCGATPSSITRRPGRGVRRRRDCCTCEVYVSVQVEMDRVPAFWRYFQRDRPGGRHGSFQRGASPSCQSIMGGSACLLATAYRWIVMQQQTRCTTFTQYWQPCGFGGRAALTAARQEVAKRLLIHILCHPVGWAVEPAAHPGGL